VVGILDVDLNIVTANKSFYAAADYTLGDTWFGKDNLQKVQADIGKVLHLKPEDQKNKKEKTLLETRFENLKWNKSPGSLSSRFR
jgi:hypothetical protein